VTLPRRERQPCMRIRPVWILPLILSLTACNGASEESPKRAAMSQRERDSVLAESGLPGAKVVRRALTASDSENQHTSTVDSASQ
jgi:hypothetical protein